MPPCRAASRARLRALALLHLALLLAGPAHHTVRARTARRLSRPGRHNFLHLGLGPGRRIALRRRHIGPGPDRPLVRLLRWPGCYETQVERCGWSPQAFAAGPGCSLIVVVGSVPPFVPAVATLVSAGQDEMASLGTHSCPRSWAFPVATSDGNQ